MKKLKSRLLLSAAVLLVVAYLALDAAFHSSRIRPATSAKSEVELEHQKAAPGIQHQGLDIWSRVRRKVHSIF